MAKQRIDAGRVVDQAVALVDTEGLHDLALNRVAEELGVQASALYNHVEGLDGLKEAVSLRSTENLASALRDAAVGRSGEQAVRAVATAYRAFATTHPGQYASTIIPPTGTGSASEPQTSILDVLARILETYDLEGDAAVHTARVVRSAIHGFVTLEANNAFTSPQDTDGSFAALLDFVVRGLNNLEPEAAAS
ncbi:MAG: AcrR family transcriptional regulator [Candidatus Aldehydirespiratoraceae bacterium]|jgi:AcrR family transcriptional regulator